jgi:hypothetical protein
VHSVEEQVKLEAKQRREEKAAKKKLAAEKVAAEKAAAEAAEAKAKADVERAKAEEEAAAEAERSRLVRAGPTPYSSTNIKARMWGRGAGRRSDEPRRGCCEATAECCDCVCDRRRRRQHWRRKRGSKRRRSASMKKPSSAHSVYARILRNPSPI